MPRVYVDFSGLQNVGSTCTTASKNVNSIESAFQHTVRSLDWDIKYEEDINKKAKQIAVKLEIYSDALQKYQQFLEEAVEAYQKLDINEEQRRSWLADLIGNNLKTEGAVLSGELSGDGTLWSIGTAGMISGGIFAWDAGIKSKAGWKIKDENGNWNFTEFDLSTTAYASGALAKGEAKGNIGLLHGEATGKVITGAVKGGVQATLWNDGAFNPVLSISGEAEGSVLQGEVEGGLGTDQFGIFAKAEGDVFHAEAKGNAGIGYLKTEDGKSVYGASAKVSAMASVAQGEVKGGFSVFGIDIDVGAKGYAGAAGVEAGGSVTTEGATATFGGALGLGAGVEVSIDWSDAEWVEDTVDWIGDAAETVGDFAEDAYDTAGEFLTNIGKTAESGFDKMFGWIG